MTRKTMNRLKLPEQYKLVRWVDEHREDIAGKNLDQIADMAQTSLGFRITPPSAKSAMAALGLKTDSRQGSDKPTVAVLTEHLHAHCDLIDRHRDKINQLVVNAVRDRVFIAALIDTVAALYERLGEEFDAPFALAKSAAEADISDKGMFPKETTEDE